MRDENLTMKGPTISLPIWNAIAIVLLGVVHVEIALLQFSSFKQ